MSDVGSPEKSRDGLPSTGEGLENRVKEIEKNLSSLKHKSWIEIAFMPLVIALVGFFVSYSITESQNESANRISAAQVMVTERKNDSDNELKALELFMKYISDKDARVRVQAINLLVAIKPNLASKLRDLTFLTDKDEQVRNATNNIRLMGSFAVVGAFRTLKNAINSAQEINISNHQYVAEVYSNHERLPSYVVTLGGYLTEEEAQKRIAYARINHLYDLLYSTEPDPFLPDLLEEYRYSIWNTAYWGRNLMLTESDIPFVRRRERSNSQMPMAPAPPALPAPN